MISIIFIRGRVDRGGWCRINMRGNVCHIYIYIATLSNICGDVFVMNVDGRIAEQPGRDMYMINHSPRIYANWSDGL